MVEPVGRATAVGATPQQTTSVSQLQLGAVGVGLVAGVAATIDGPQPVGANLSSTVLVVLAVAGVCRVGASAPRPLLAWAVLLAGVATVSLPAILLALAVFVVVELGRRSTSMLADTSPHAGTVSAALAGVAMVLAAHSDLGGFLGASTVVGATIGLIIVIGGLARSGRRTRRVTGAVVLAVAAAAAVGSAAFVVSALSVDDELRDAEAFVRTGLSQLGDADLAAAEASFRQASQEFERADERFASPLGALGATVPVVAQHRSAVTVLSDRAATTTARVADLLDDLDGDTLSLVDSQVDLDAVVAFGAALEEIQASLDVLDDDIERVSSPWLLPVATSQLDELRDEIDDQRSRADRVTEVTAALPAMLGGDRPRVYLLLFTTPAEARGLGGFTGNWAEITLDDGRVTVSDFGRADELDDAAPGGVRRITGPSDWLDRYGRFGFTNDVDGTVGADPFKNITMSPLMSSTGQVVAELYPQSGGRELDGVLAADVYVLAELLRFTGPIDVPGVDRTIGAENAAEFLLNRQYAIPDRDERIDSIAAASSVVIDRLLGGGVEMTPNKLLRVLGPMAEQGRLAGWAVEPGEQDVLVEVGLAGTMQQLDTDDGFTVALNNTASSKIDYFLEGAARYEAQVSADGTVDGVVEVTLRNTAPAEGQPRYVIANAIQAPLGTNQTLLSIYTALPASDLTVDGVAVTGGSSIEAGYYVTDALVLMPPGTQRTVRLRVAGGVDVTDGYSLLVRSPPAVGSMPIDVELTVTDATGQRTLRETLDDAGVRRVDVDMSAAR